MEAKYSVDPTDMTRIKNNFTYHPVNQEQAERMTYLRQAALTLSSDILRQCPISPDRSRALIKIEEAIFHANAAIARNEPVLPVTGTKEKSWHSQ